jgi:hypothetical protein
LEFFRPSEETVIKTIYVAEPLPGEKAEAFSVVYQRGNGRIEYRGTCFLPRPHWTQAFVAISWAPGRGVVTGGGWPVPMALRPERHRRTRNEAGGIGQESSRERLPSFEGVAYVGGPSLSINWDNYDHYDYCYYVADGDGNPLYVLYCGYGECEPTMDLRASSFSGLAGGSGCSDPSNPGGGGGGGGGDDGDEWLPLEPPNCDPLPSYESKPRQYLWCTGPGPGPVYGPILDSAAQQIIGVCPEYQDEWYRVQGNIRMFSHTNQQFGGAASVNGDWMLLSFQRVDHDPVGSLLHELLHISGMDHPGGSQEAIAFTNELYRCSGVV